MRERASIILVALIACVLFLAPAVHNGAPLLFPDSIGYARTGDAALGAFWKTPDGRMSGGGQGAAPRLDTQGDGVSTERSPYFGVPVALLGRSGSQWPLAVLQSLFCIIGLYLLTGRLVTLPPLYQLLTGATAGLIGGLGIFAGTVMPDVYGGFSVAGIALLACNYRELRLIERVFWASSIFAACLFHKPNLLVLILMLAPAAALRWRSLFVTNRAIMLIFLLAVGSWGAHALVPLAVNRLSGEAARSAPFLLSRVVGDGTAKLYLDRHCGEREYLLCRFRDQMPMNENEFLWSRDYSRGVWQFLTRAERERLDREENDIVYGAIFEFPWHQAGASLRNFAEQFTNVGATRFASPVNLSADHVPHLVPTLARYRTTAVVAGAMTLKTTSILMLIAYLLAFAAIAAFVIRGPAETLYATQRGQLRLLLLTGVIANAAVFGILSSGADRYQGRIAWIPVVVAFCLIVEAAQRQRAGQISG